MMIIGLTGPVGSGKTAVAKLFSRHRYSRIDADGIGHQLFKKNTIIYKKIINAFGNKILGKNSNIDRKKLGEIVFNEDKKLRKLNSIMHPLIINEIKNNVKKIKQECGSKAKIIVDAPLLLETKAKNLVDKIIVVKCSKENILKRNRKFTRQQIERILKAQMPLKEKLKYADFVIDNNKDLNDLEKQVENIVQKLNQK